MDVARHYQHLSQALFDALTPFVDAYENATRFAESELPQDTPVVVEVTLADVRRAQMVLHLVASGDGVLA